MFPEATTSSQFGNFGFVFLGDLPLQKSVNLIFKLSQMTRLVFIILIGCDLLFPCEGEITLKFGKATRCVKRGSNVTIKWDTPTANVIRREWLLEEEILAFIVVGDKEVTIQNSSLPRVEVKKPGTLILRNVTSIYNGTYTIKITGRTSKDDDKSDVTVIIAVKPNVTVCKSSYTVIEGGNVICSCKGKNGNPPANVTWYDEDGGRVRDLEQKNTLTLFNITRAKNGTKYKCAAKSCNLRDEKSVEVIVQYQPDTPMFTNAQCVFNGTKNLNIRCESSGQPLPSFKLFHNDTIALSNTNTYTINEVKYKDSGSYKCVAKNVLGNSSETFNLTVAEKPKVTINCSSPITVNETDDVTCRCEGANVTWYNGSFAIRKTEVQQNMLNLKLISITRSYNGTKFKCEAQSCNFKAEKSIEVIVQYLPDTPVFKNTLSAVNNSARNFTIMCESSGQPQPSFKIFHNDSILVSNTNTYTIDVVKYEDAGSYKCLAKNKLGNSLGTFHLTVVAKLTVMPAVTINCSSSTTVNEGCDVMCLCKGGGAKVAWYKDDVQFGQTGVGKQSLSLTKIKRGDAGHYTCKAQGNKPKTIKIIVESPWCVIVPIVTGSVTLMASIVVNVWSCKKRKCSTKVPWWIIFVIVFGSLALVTIIVAIVRWGEVCCEDVPWWIVFLVALNSLGFVLIIVVVVWCCVKDKWCEKEKCGHRGNVSPSPNRLGENPYDSIDRKSPPGGNDVVASDPSANPSTGQYDTVNFPTTASDEAPGGPKPIGINSTIGNPTSADDGAPGGAKPTDPAHVYASVDKSRNYASLDTMAMQAKNPKDTKAAEKTEYASIQF